MAAAALSAAATIVAVILLVGCLREGSLRLACALGILMVNLPHILLVEDEPLIRTALSLALEDGGYGVLEASNSDEAIEIIDRGEQLSGVITDIRLGVGATGWEVGRQARHRYASIAVVYMTGDSAADWVAEGVPNSVLLQKPFAAAQLITAVSTLLNVVDVSPVQANPAAS